MMEKVYFLGIGGIGMSALARWFNAHGAEVAGYDRTPSALTRALKEEGIAVDHSGALDELPAGLLQDMKNESGRTWTIVWTPAIPADFPLLVALNAAGYTPLKRAELLGRITRDKPLLAVAGTHGKTTTTSLLAHMLSYNGTAVEAFLGGIALEGNSNLLLSKETGDAPLWMVAEADEFDRSFLHLRPTHAAITSVDPDHLDIYGTHKKMLAAFADFAHQVAPGGLLVHTDAAAAWSDPSALQSVGAQIYGPLKTRESLEVRGWSAGYSDVRGEDGQAKFTLHLRGQAPMQISWRLPGTHNAANATAAAHLAVQAGIAPLQVPATLSAFSGVARRFEIKRQSDTRVIVDDYAHHPREIAGTIAAARLTFPNRKITGIFQPHLYSRTQDFLEDFAAALSKLDACVLLPIYAAREAPIPGVDAHEIGEKMVGCPVKCPPENRFLDVLEKLDPDVLLFMGAGDLDRWIEPAWNRLEKKTTQPPIDAP